MCNVVAVLRSNDFAILLSRQQRVATPPPLLPLPPPPSPSYFPRFILRRFPSPIDSGRVPPFFTPPRKFPNSPRSLLTRAIALASSLFPIVPLASQVSFDTHLKEKKDNGSRPRRPIIYALDISSALKNIAAKNTVEPR